ncbi:MAG: DUF4038 domain-containing protein [Candidatus Omnitrophica bacterium]|nr:DUF4038 domain-containing protein [Candidatus Omnitrophota bacterium]MCB9783711.1 DUF4038 domain-containing protein [Candidatus Omnitrophota bacterium]
MNGKAQRNCVTEIRWESAREYSDPYNQIELDVEITKPSGKTLKQPAFWNGGKNWMARVAIDELGEATYRTVCSDSADTGLQNQTGKIEVSEYVGSNPLFQKGRLQISEDKTHFVYSNGDPFFWIGDTWWMGLCKRLDFPQGFETLTKDRVKKGFNVIQIVAGPYPDMDYGDERGMNEAGLPLSKDFKNTHPEYFDLADLKIEHLVKSGLSPCIVGMWGYYLPRIGVEGAKRFWRYLIARYGAYPVLWCIAGEGTMAYYLSQNKEEESAFQKKGWTEVAKYIQEVDGYNTPVSIHPTRYGREQVEDPNALDFEMLQTGHGDLESVSATAKTVQTAIEREPKMPVVNSEVNYEGIMGRTFQNIVRLSFYASVFNGAVGFTYGANGIWQLNTPDKPYGPSPHGRCWGNTPWQEAYQLPGSREVALGAKLLSKFPFWEMERHPEWVDYDADNPYTPTAYGISEMLRLIYTPLLWNPPKVYKVEDSVTYRASYFDPISGDSIDIGKVIADQDGVWQTEVLPPEVHDWVIVMEVM